MQYTDLTENELSIAQTIADNEGATLSSVINDYDDPLLIRYGTLRDQVENYIDELPLSDIGLNPAYIDEDAIQRDWEADGWNEVETEDGEWISYYWY